MANLITGAELQGKINELGITKEDLLGRPTANAGAVHGLVKEVATGLYAKVGDVEALADTVVTGEGLPEVDLSDGKTVTIKELGSSLTTSTKTINVTEFLSMARGGNFSTEDGAPVTEFSQITEGGTYFYSVKKTGN